MLAEAGQFLLALKPDSIKRRFVPWKIDRYLTKKENFETKDGSRTFRILTGLISRVGSFPNLPQGELTDPNVDLLDAPT